MISILEKKALRGANIYSYRPAIVMTIDLGEFAEVPTSQIDGFADQLLEMIPSLDDHRCSEGVNSILTGRPYDLEASIGNLKDIRDDHYLGPSTAAIVREAELRNITVLRLDDYNLVQLGEGKYQKRIKAAMTFNTSLIGVETAGNKRLTKMMLEDAGVPVPKGTVVRKLQSAIEDAKWLGYPVMVKPHDGHHGKGVTTNI
jgi:cyanophycin synthetase